MLESKRQNLGSNWVGNPIKKPYKRLRPLEGNGLRYRLGEITLLVGEKETKTKRALFKDCMPGASPAKLPIKETAVVLHYILVYKCPSLTTILPTSTLMFSRSAFFLFKGGSSDLLPCKANRQWYSGAAATARESRACA